MLRSFFAVQFPLFESEPLIPGGGGGPAPVASSPQAPRRIVCDCCGCQLASDGGVLKTGDRAKEFQKADDTIDALKREVARLESELSTARTKIAELTPPARAARDDW